MSAKSAPDISDSLMFNLDAPNPVARTSGLDSPLVSRERRVLLIPFHTTQIPTAFPGERHPDPTNQNPSVPVQRSDAVSPFSQTPPCTVKRRSEHMCSDRRARLRSSVMELFSHFCHQVETHGQWLGPGNGDPVCV